MVYAPVRLIISSLKLGNYLSVQAHKPCSISHLLNRKNSILGLSEPEKNAEFLNICILMSI